MDHALDSEYSSLGLFINIAFNHPNNEDQFQFIEDLVLWGLFAYSFVSQTVLFCRSVVIPDRLSANVLINIGAWCLTTFVGLIYIGYLLMSHGRKDRDSEFRGVISGFVESDDC
jgi:uncharacterized membrane protein